MKKLKNFIPLLIILILMALFWGLGFDDYLSYEVFQKHRLALLKLVGQHPILAPIATAVIYAVFVALSVPVGLILSLFVGFLFPQPISTIVVVLGATTGAVIIFIVAKTALRSFFEKKVRGFLPKMRKGFKENSISYLLILRLVPIFPFWIVNIAPAFFNVSLWTYFWTSLLGMLPWSFVYTQAGKAIDEMFASDKPFSILDFFSVEMIIALVVIGILVLVPIFLKKKKNRKKK